jgi:endonuclease YncB( thermonuclease family)
MGPNNAPNKRVKFKAHNALLVLTSAIFLISISFIIFAYWKKSSRGVENQHLEIVDVIDGDTILMRDTEQNKLLRLRLIGIDTPEKNKRFHQQARDLTSTLLSSNNYTISTHAQDHYKRKLISITIIDSKTKEQDDLGKKLLEMGLAKIDGPPVKLKEQYKKAEEHAREQRLGIWGKGTETK